ncbi:hypothetical protein [Falsihalocynthiibacter arcticus]|uniref:Uncharacterized protein n=1 Tax=Falsihalocynthiibacter arcticus TaxID=1579316 RepID=A0A126V2Q9_9RHOB|nr:hypothetical protein [Falsihalocynthiibacter arcticus]AML52604.1 hypothetical protein RC74_16190 [Falsihalocynthiibacter arcticus]
MATQRKNRELLELAEQRSRIAPELNRERTARTALQEGFKYAAKLWRQIAALLMQATCSGSAPSGILASKPDAEMLAPCDKTQLASGARSQAAFCFGAMGHFSIL